MCICKWQKNISLMSGALIQASGVLLILLLIIGEAVAQPDERNIDRSGFAPPEQPAWVALTPFEERVLSRFSRSSSHQAFDLSVTPDATDLLNLYLLASGDVRNEHEARDLARSIEQFLADNASLARIRDERQRGARLLQAMHRHFHEGGYEADQSALSTLLRTGVYNCISSALLYIVLAEHLDLRTAGVIMPSHAFVQVLLSDGHVAEVETTAAEGFDVVRDEQFFAEQASDWFEQRRLVVPSYEDYARRQVVSAAGLGFENMWSQHVSVGRMDYANRMRMAELKGLLQSGEIDAQHNRLVYYQQEADYLRRQANLPLLDRFLLRAEPLLLELRAQLDAGSFMAGNDDTLIPLLLLLTELADQKGRVGELPLAIDLARLTIRESASGSLPEREAGIIRDSAFRALHTVMQFYITSQDFDASLAVLQGLDAQCQQSAHCINALEYHFMAHSQHYWQQQRWLRVIAVSQNYLDLGVQTDNTPAFIENMESAYLNESALLWRDEARDEAIAMLQTCLIRLGSRLTSAQRCQQRLQSLELMH